MSTTIQTDDVTIYTIRREDIEYRWCQFLDGFWYLGIYANDTLIEEVRLESRKDVIAQILAHRSGDRLASE